MASCGGGGASGEREREQGKLYGECLMSREALNELGVPFYSVTRLAPRRQKIRSPATTFL